MEKIINEGVKFESGNKAATAEKVVGDPNVNINFSAPATAPAGRNMWKKFISDTNDRLWQRIRNFSLRRAINNAMVTLTRLSVMLIAAIMVYNFIQANPEAWASIVGWFEGIWDGVVNSSIVQFFINIFA